MKFPALLFLLWLGLLTWGIGSTLLASPPQPVEIWI